MKTNLIPGFSGAALAMMAAGLSLATPATAAPAKHGHMAAANDVALVHCSGVNQCKGHNDCKTAANACKGQGSCKGKGFVATSADACASLSGSVIDPGTTMAVAASSQVHCYGINACKGHNDCKTASNACKGQGSCKGKGFIALPSSSCSAGGGNTTAA